MHSPTPSSITLDRRRHQRKSSGDGDEGYFMVAGQPAKLVDWSFGGIGVAVDEPLRFSTGDQVELRLYDPGQEGWEALDGEVRRVHHNGTLGISFADDGETTVRVLLRLLSNRLARTLS